MFDAMNNEFKGGVSGERCSLGGGSGDMSGVYCSLLV